MNISPFSHSASSLFWSASFFVILVSCGEPEGRYTDEYGHCTYEFGEETVKIEFSETEFEYLYEIKKLGDSHYMYFYDKETSEEALDPLKYEDGDGYVILDGVKYFKEH